VTEGIELAMRDIGPEAGLEVMRLEHWEFVKAQTLDTIFANGLPRIALEHAAVIETSMMLHYHPQLVCLDQIPDYGPAEFAVYCSSASWELPQAARIRSGRCCAIAGSTSWRVPTSASSFRSAP
jgi:creatinine amidohydrolase/Fe(II)-dependent formamide hydrolase-like protein